MLTLPVLHHTEGLECGNDVVGMNGHLLTDIFDGKLRPGPRTEVTEEDVFPVGTVGDETEVTERFFGGANFALHASEEVAWRKESVTFEGAKFYKCAILIDVAKNFNRKPLEKHIRTNS